MALTTTSAEGSTSPARLERGSLVAIVDGVQVGSRAVVTRVADAHVTATVLDEGLSEGTEELWPSFGQVRLISKRWCLGTPVVIYGLRGRSLAAFNGHRGVVVEQRRYGHPAFVQEAGGAAAKLRVVVRMDSPPAGAQRTVFLQARYVMTQEEYLLQVAKDTAAAVRAMGLDCKELVGAKPGKSGDALHEEQY